MKHLKNIMCIALSCLCLNVFSQQIEPLTPMIESESGDVYSHDSRFGVVLTSPDGTCFRIRVENSGAMVSEPVNCSTTGNPSITMAPTPNTTLTGSSQTFTISPNNPAWTYGFWIGSVNDITTANDVYFNSGALTSNNVINATGLPTNGEPLYLRTAINKGNGIEFELFEYTAHSSSPPLSTVPDFYDTNAGSFVWREFRQGVSTSNSTTVTHNYSVTNAFNSTEEYIALIRNNGGVYDVVTGDLLFTQIPYGLLGGPSGRQNVGCMFWDKDIPYRMWGIEYGDSKLTYLDIRDYAVGASSPPPAPTLVYQEPDGKSLLIGKTQGQPDMNQQYIALEADREDVYILDLTTGNVVRTFDQPSGSLTNASIVSKTGKYVMISSGTPSVINFYNVQTGAFTGNCTNRNHAAWLLGDDGKDYLSVVGNPIGLYNPETNVLEAKSTSAGYGHCSGSIPGWIVGSYDNGGNMPDDGPYICKIGDNWNTDAVNVSAGLPDGGWISGVSYAISQMRASPSKSGKHIVVGLCARQTNVVDVWLGTWTP